MSIPKRYTMLRNGLIKVLAQEFPDDESGDLDIVLTVQKLKVESDTKTEERKVPPS